MNAYRTKLELNLTPERRDTDPFGTLKDYHTAATIRPATQRERDASRREAESGGGAGVIEVDGQACYVEE